MMPETNNNFDVLVETIYNLPLDEKQELRDLLEHNITDARRAEIASNYKKAQAEHKAGKLKFSSSLKGLKKML